MDSYFSHHRRTKTRGGHPVIRRPETPAKHETCGVKKKRKRRGHVITIVMITDRSVNKNHTYKQMVPTLNPLGIVKEESICNETFEVRYVKIWPQLELLPFHFMVEWSAVSNQNAAL